MDPEAGLLQEEDLSAEEDVPESPHARGRANGGPNTLRQPLMDDVHDAFGVEEVPAHRHPLQRLTWRRTSKRSLEVGPDSVQPCTVVRYYERYELKGSPMLKEIEHACKLLTAEEVCNYLEPVAPEQGDTADMWEALYVTFRDPKKSTHVEIKIHAVHLAASLGSTCVLQWLVDHCSPDVLCYQSIMGTVNERTKAVTGCREHYTPLMSALFMSQVETAIWILEKAPASATLENADCLTPLHMIAWLGLPSISAELRTAALERTCHTLVEKKAGLLTTVEGLRGRQDKFARMVRNKTPLEVAVETETSFPKQMLHLLTESYHYPSKSRRLFIEINIIAKANPAACVELLGKIKERAPNQVQESLRAEVRNHVVNNSHLGMFIETLKMSPIAAAKLLGLLMGEPKVADPQRYHLPLYTVLPNREMICTYQPVELGPDAKDTDDPHLPIWKNISRPLSETEPLPMWHREFRRTLPSDPLLHTDVYEVKVKVLHLPDILNLKVVSILSMVWNNWDNMKVFAEIPIRPTIAGLWRRYADEWRFCMFWAALLLTAIIALGLRVSEPFGFEVELFIRSLIVANLFFEGANLAYGFAVCRGRAEVPHRTYLYFVCFTMVNWLALLILANTEYPVTSPQAKVLAAGNILLRCFWIVLEFRVVPVVGPLIIAVLQSFQPMIGMFSFMGMMFVTFAFTFLTMKDDDRSTSYVLLNLYQALFLTDSDGAEGISGIDIGHQQTLDFGVEMYTGGGNGWLLAATSACMLFATSTFSLVLLNLTIGMYTKFYEMQEPLARLAFQQCRARISVTFMLRPSLPQSWLAKIGEVGYGASWARWALWANALPFLVMHLVVVFVIAPQKRRQGIDIDGSIPAGFFLSIFLLAIQASLLIHNNDLDQRHRFLWVSYRSDYSDNFYMNQDAELTELKSELRDAERRQSAEIARQTEEIARLSQDVKALAQQLKIAHDMLQLGDRERGCMPQ